MWSRSRTSAVLARVPAGDDAVGIPSSWPRGISGTQASGRRETVAVVDRLPAYRHGLATALAAQGFQVAELSGSPKPGADHDALVMTLNGAEDWAALTALRASQPNGVVIALLGDPKVGGYRRALRLGVAGVVAHDAAIEDIVAVVEASLTGHALLPWRIVRHLAEAEIEGDESLPISDSEAGWLRAMARGTTIANMARSARYSERQMHRLMRCLYGRMGVSSREEALVLAARWGVLG